MVLNRKGVVFTLIAILISGFLFILYATEYRPKENSLLPVITNRIRILDRHNENFVKYTLESMDISTYKAMNGMIAHIDDHGFFPDFESAFTECVQNGTLNDGVDVCPDMANGTLPYWLNETINISRNRLGFNVTYTIQGIRISQPLPFQVQVEVDLHYEVWDVFATINRTVSLRRLVSIEGLMDPLYVGSGTYNNSIAAAPTRDDAWNVGTLHLMIENRTYRHHTDAPSFLLRFEGSLLNSTCCGIESMIHPAEVGAFDNRSFVDFLFWNETELCGGIPPQIVYKIDDPRYDPKFRLEERHLVAYNISSDQWISGC